MSELIFNKIQEQHREYQRQMARIGSVYNITQLRDKPEKTTNISKVYQTTTQDGRTSVQTMASKARYEVEGGLTNGKNGIICYFHIKTRMDDIFCHPFSL